MKSFLLIVSFFTRLPFGNLVSYTDERYRKSILYFPLVGLIIGVFTFIPFWFENLQASYKAFLAILIYLWISGGIHLDGLADSADGLLSGRPKERILEIMKDSRIGSFGVIALILYFLSFYTFAQSATPWVMLFMPFVGKTLGFVLAGFSIYARPDQGMGYVFITEIQKPIALFYGLLLGGVTFLALGLTGLIAVMAALLVGILLAADAHKKIGGMTGDTIGMSIEVMQMAFITAFALLSH